MEVRHNEVSVLKDMVMKDKVGTGIRYHNSGGQSQYEDAANRP